MLFDVGSFADLLDKASPRLSRVVCMRILGLISPFNAHLKAQMKIWTPKKVVLAMKCHRSVKNHVGGIHAGALFTIGESCAGLVIVRNFNFKKYRPLMTEITAQFAKQARSAITAKCEVSAEALKKVKAEIKAGDSGLLPMQTIVFDEKGLPIAKVKTVWQIKAWDAVKTKSEPKK